MNDPIVLVDQASAAPTRKVSASALAGAFVVLIMWGADQVGVKFSLVEHGAILVLVSALVAYFVRDEMQPPVVVTPALPLTNPPTAVLTPPPPK